MSNPQKQKGARAERECASLISDHLGVKVVRRHNLGTHEDLGDLIMPNTTIQVCDWRDVSAAVHRKPRECVVQQDRAGMPFGATFVRLRGGEWRVVLTPEQWFAVMREVMT